MGKHFQVIETFKLKKADFPFCLVAIVISTTLDQGFKYQSFTSFSNLSDCHSNSLLPLQ